MTRPGPVFDDAMKLLADDDLDAVLSVVGVEAGAQRLNVELAASTRSVDLLAQTRAGLVHVEFVKDRAPGLDLRMVDYRVRIRRLYRDLPLLQIVLVLKDLAVPDHYEEIDDKLSCTWSVVRLADLDAAPLLARPTTAALAALAHGTPPERGAVLAYAVDIISRETSADRRRILLGAATTLASIVLPRDTIDSALKEAMMPVPVRETPLGMELLEEGREEGVVVETRALLLHRFGADPRIDAVAARLVGLTAGERVDKILSATSLDDLAG